MIRLLHGELIKLRTTRTALGYASAAALIVVLVVLLSILSGDPRTIDDKRDALSAGAITSFLVIFFGIVGSGADYRHRTLAPALLVAPSRARLLLARLVAYGLAGMAITAGMLVLAFAIGLPLLAGQPGPDLRVSDYVYIVAGGLGGSALCAMLGVAVGALLARQVPALIGTMVWLFFLEPLLDIVNHDATKFTIGQTQNAVSGGTGGGALLPWGVAAVVLAGWTALFAVAAGVVDRRRDVT